MNRELIIALAFSLASTLILETGFFLLIGKRNIKDLMLVILVNVLTNPAVVLLYWLAVRYTDWDTIGVMIPLELFAILTEGYYYRKYGQSFSRPFLFSFAANMFSFSLGLFIQRAIF